MSGMAERKAKRKDSLAELENFIDSYSNPDTEQGNDETAQMVNVLREQMMMNLNLLSTMGVGMPNPLGMQAMPNPLAPGLNPLAQTAINPFLLNPLLNPLMAMGGKSPFMMNPAVQQTQEIPKPPQIIPIPKGQSAGDSPFPTVMIPGYGPCLMVPQQPQQSAQSFLNQKMSQKEAQEHFINAKLQHGSHNNLDKNFHGGNQPLTRSVSDDKRRNSLKHMAPPSDRRESLPDLKFFPKQDSISRRRHSLAAVQGIKEEKVAIKSKVSGTVFISNQRNIE